MCPNVCNTDVNITHRDITSTNVSLKNVVAIIVDSTFCSKSTVIAVKQQ